MYCAVPSGEFASIRPLPAQKPFHHEDCVASSEDVLAVVSPPMRFAAVDVGSPPVHCGEARITRNEPSLFGVKLTRTWVELTTEADTFCPPAVIAAIAPKVWFENPVCELSTHV